MTGICGNGTTAEQLSIPVQITMTSLIRMTMTSLMVRPRRPVLTLISGSAIGSGANPLELAPEQGYYGESGDTASAVSRP